MYRTTVLVKCLLLCAVISLVLFVFVDWEYLRERRLRARTGNASLVKYTKGARDGNASLVKPTNMKYILQWTSDRTSPFVYMGQGQSAFIAENCSNTNCYVTHDRGYLADVVDFDAIVFSGTEVRIGDIPRRRSPRQKYVFGTIESADNYPICDERFDGFFNWTWTYRIASDTRWGYIAVRNTSDALIAPALDPRWSVEAGPLDAALLLKIATKTKAAAWFVSNCYSRSGREQFVREVQEALRPLGLGVDVYGACGPLRCSRDDMAACLEALRRDYHFYFAFENSFSEDYVTEKVLHALQSDTVPVVYGGANYSRFLPPGAYLDARALGASGLARAMAEAMKDPVRYQAFFRYQRHYTFTTRNSRPETNDYCGFCALLNDERRVREVSVYQQFREWWNVPGRCP